MKRRSGMRAARKSRTTPSRKTSAAVTGLPSGFHVTSRRPSNTRGRWPWIRSTTASSSGRTSSAGTAIPFQRAIAEGDAHRRRLGTKPIATAFSWRHRGSMYLSGMHKKQIFHSSSLHQGSKIDATSSIGTQSTEPMSTRIAIRAKTHALVHHQNVDLVKPDQQRHMRKSVCAATAQWS